MVELLVGHQTSDSWDAGSSPAWALLCSGLRQATYTCVPLSPSSITCTGESSEVNRYAT